MYTRDYHINHVCVATKYKQAHTSPSFSWIIYEPTVYAQLSPMIT